MTKQHPWKLPSRFLWLAMAAWGTLVLLLTTLPGDTRLIRTLSGLLGGTELSGAVGHMGLFLLLTALVWVALRQWLRARTALLVTMAFALLLGMSTELFQWFVAGRDASLADLLANWLGVFVAGFAVDHLALLRS